MGLTITTDDETLIKDLVNTYNWVEIDLNEQKRRLMVNYFGADPKQNFDKAYEILDDLAGNIMPTFWYEEGLKAGISKTEFRSVIVKFSFEEDLETARMYGYLIVSNNEQLNPDLLLKEGMTTEEVINGLRDCIKETTDSETMG